MVSNTLKMDLGDLLGALERLRQESADDPEYQQLRSALPADWPM